MPYVGFYRYHVTTLPLVLCDLFGCLRLRYVLVPAVLPRLRVTPFYTRGWFGSPGCVFHLPHTHSTFYTSGWFPPPAFTRCLPFVTVVYVGYALHLRLRFALLLLLRLRYLRFPHFAGCVYVGCRVTVVTFIRSVTLRLRCRYTLVVFPVAVYLLLITYGYVAVALLVTAFTLHVSAQRYGYRTFAV